MAGAAKHQLERKARFGVRQLIGRKQSVGQGKTTEIEDWLDAFGTAGQALHAAAPRTLKNSRYQPIVLFSPPSSEYIGRQPSCCWALDESRN